MAADEDEEEDVLTDTIEGVDDGEPVKGEAKWEQLEEHEEAVKLYTIEFKLAGGGQQTYLNCTMGLEDILKTAKKNGGWFVGETSMLNLKYATHVSVTESYVTEKEGFEVPFNDNLR